MFANKVIFKFKKPLLKNKCSITYIHIIIIIFVILVILVILVNKYYLVNYISYICDK